MDEILKSLADAIESTNKELELIDYEKYSEEYYTAKEKIEEARDHLNRIEAEIEENKMALSNTGNKINSLYCAKLYKEICDLESKLKATQSEIKAKSENDDNAKRLNDLGFSVMQIIDKLYPKVREELANKKDEYALLQNRLTNIQNELKSLQEGEGRKRTAYDRAEEAVKNACVETDKDLNVLAIDIMRYLDGNYRMDEIQKYKVDMDNKQVKLQTDIEKQDNRMKKLSERNSKIESECRN